MFGLGVPELLVIGGIVVLLFGARRLPELGSGVGKAIRGFKAGISGEEEEQQQSQKEKATLPEGSAGTPTSAPTRAASEAPDEPR